MFEWEELHEGAERFSFYDSDRFEEDSLCSWNSEPEPAPNNWRGWKRPSNPNASSAVASTAPQFHAQLSNGHVPSLVELAARQVASHIPFEVVERFPTPVPEPLQLRIAFWSFPENEDDIRLYSCLGNGNADEFIRGEQLFRNKAVSQALQIGFHLSATVTIPLSNINSTVVNLPSSTNPPAGGQSSGACNTFQLPLKEAAKSDKTITPSISNTYHVAITFDRRRITSCTCTCNGSASWCNHIVAVCLHRIHHVTYVKLRAPVSESLSRLRRDQLQKFAQYLISELPQQILPTAQRLLDDLLSAQASPINTVCGAPDPTAGASVGELTSWCFNETALHENIRKTLIKFCVPSPIVFSDVNYLSCTAPPAAAEWTSLLRPLRGREPEGMWNLLSIVREMFRRHDRNAIQLLQVLTEECLACEQILVWWFNTKVALHSGSSSYNGRNGNVNGNNAHASQHATSSLCDEIVALWRLAALNPALSPSCREILVERFKTWHAEVVQRVQKSRAVGVPSNANQGSHNGGGHGGNANQRHFVSKIDLEAFTGFKPSIEACSLTWEDYQISGVTYTKGSLFDGQHVACLLPHDSSSGGSGRQPNINSSQVVLNCGMSGKCKGVASSSLPGLGSFEPAFALNNSSSSANQTPNGKLGDKSKADRGSVSSEGFSDGNVNGTSGDASRQQDDEIESDLSTSPDNEDPASPLAASPPENGGNGEFDDDVLSSAAAAAPASSNPDAPHRNENVQIIPNVGHVKKLDDPLEILFARAEALHAHGYSSEASTLAVRLAQELLVNPPDLMVDFPPPPMTKHKRRRCRVNPVSHQTSCLASATLAKASFLCSVLSEIPEYQSLAFRVGLFGLELARPPASTKALEVKMANQELELVNWLKKIPLTATELGIIREKAGQLRDGLLRSRGDALLPLQLAGYILDALVMSVSRSANGSASGTPACQRIAPISASMSAVDEQLGFDAAVAALGLKANVSEAEHPLLCEGTRRQRGDLALTLLVHYKDDREKLAAIMDKLLDRQVHQMYKAQPLSSYYATNKAVGGAEQPQSMVSGAMATLSMAENAAAAEEREGAVRGPPPPTNNHHGGPPPGHPHHTGARPKEYFVNPRPGPSAGGGMAAANATGDEGMWEDPECNKLWEAKFRCANLRTCFSKKNSNPMASIDSSAPETTSSDNSPTVIRRAWKIQGPGSDSGSSGKSSDSSGLSSSEGEKSKQKNRTTPAGPCGPGGAAGGLTPANVVRMVSVPGTDATGAAGGSNQGGLVSGPPVPSGSSPLMSGPPPVVGYYPPLMSQPPMAKDNRQQPNGGSTANGGPSAITTTGNSPVGMNMGNGKNNRFKSKRNYPTIPNQPSEAGAHFMFELAKTVLAKAGGNSSTSLFTDTSATGNHRGPHRALHMCAFQIGLYALGLHNCVSPNWLSRTYSSHVSWISGQALEIGESAVSFLMKTWEGHLTPPEVANLADRASRSRDPGMVRVAAELALSVLPHAHALNPNEIQTAITQCKEHSDELLEKACLAVETAAKGGGVSPDVLFKVARRWHDLFGRLHVKNTTYNNNSADNSGGSRSAANNADGPSNDEGFSGDFSVGGNYLDQDPVLSVSASLSHAHAMPPPLHPHPVVEGIQVDLSMPSTSNPPSLVNSNHAPPVHAYSFQVGLAAPYPTYASFTYMPHLTSPYSPLPYPLNLAYYQQGLAAQPPQNSGPVQSHHSHHGHHNGYHQAPHHMGLAGQAPGAPGPQSSPLLPHPGSGVGGPPGPHCTIYPIRHPQSMLSLPMGNPGDMGSGPNGVQGGGNPMGVSSAAQAQMMRQGTPSPLNMPGGHSGNGGTPPPAGSHHPYSGQSPGPVQTRPLLPYTQQEYGYLLAAYRVGMLAMETLATRVHDDRPQAKYAPNPPYGDDVKWLLQLSMKLGNPYLHQFCISAVHSVVSPFVLQEIGLEAATYLSRQSNGTNGAPGGLGLGGPTGAPPLMATPMGASPQGVGAPSSGNSAASQPSLHALTHHLRSPMLSPLVQRCQQMFIQCTHQRLYHITPSEYEDFVSIVRSARTAFQMTLGGPSQFQELLQSLKRSKFCKKDLWQRITAVLQQSPGQH